MKRAFGILVATLLVLQAAVPALAAPFDVGQPAIDFTLPNFDTKESDSLAGELKKSVVVISWFSSTCSACRSEIQALKAAVDSGKIDSSVKIILVNIDFSDANIASYKKAQGIENLTVLHDPKFTTPLKYGFRSTPALVVIDKKGNISYKHVGYEAGQIDEIVGGISKAL